MTSHEKRRSEVGVNQMQVKGICSISILSHFDARMALCLGSGQEFGVDPAKLDCPTMIYWVNNSASIEIACNKPGTQDSRV